jgi:precorrin-3B synthase
MNMPAIKGWCPGALRPMESGDGLIVRLKLTGGIVPLDLAMEIADWSRRFGNGEIDLTVRANLQIRGVTDATLPGLRDAIAEAGLLDENPDGEAIRNVIASPLAGLDPEALLDIRPTVAALEARLASDQRLYLLPPKFCFVVDDGGRLGLGDIRADIRFEAKRIDGKLMFAIYDDGGEDRRIGSCNPEHVAEAAALLTLGFFAYRRDLGPAIRRMRDVVAAIGIRTLAGGGARGSTKSRAHPSQRKLSAEDYLGMHSLSRNVEAQASPEHGYSIGVGVPFGRVSAENFGILAQTAKQSGAKELRLTPWRAFLVPCPSEEGAQQIAQAVPPDAFILDPVDPRRRVAACVGAPACRSATTGVREDAGRLAPLVPERTFLHVSGCAKGCAHPRPAPVTLVGNDGLYDLVRDGTPSDSPALRGLTLDEAAAYLRQMAATQTQGRAT